MGKINLYIHSKDGKSFTKNNIDEVYFTSKNVGDIGLMSGSNPFIGLLDVSHVFFKINNEKVFLATSGGLIDFNNNECSLLLDTFEFVDEIDEKRAFNEKENALNIINNKDIYDDKILKYAQFSLKKAINRIKLIK